MIDKIVPAKKTNSYQNIQLSQATNTTILSGKLSDSDILSLQDMFLTNGVHSITVETVEAGRMLMQQFLTSLGCYNAIAVVTMKDPIKNFQVIDLYNEILAGRSFEPLSCEYDFLWIEASEELLSSIWFASFEQALLKANLYVEIPIFIVS